MRIFFLFILTCALGGAALNAAPLRVLVCSPNETFRNEFAALLRDRGAQAEAAVLPDETKLAHTDVVVLYASEVKAMPGFDPALLRDFTNRGGGIVALHGAVAAGSASELKSLLGGAWEVGRSQLFTSRMMLYVSQSEHPVIRGASSFDMDDDTLYDLDLAPEIQVLGSAFTPKLTGRRQQPPGASPRVSVFDIQPQMWAYESPVEAGQSHRAFVALQGNSKTLQHLSFRTFALRGIAWTARRADVDELCTKAELDSLMYPADGPSRPEQTVAQIDVHPGFRMSVVAAEPLIHKPIAVQRDPDGRLWVAETPEYPNGRRPAVAAPWKETSPLFPGITNRPAHDRISILSEPDAHGQFTKKSLFYEGLELVTGFCFYKDGVIAIHEPDIVWLRDTDGDGKADKVERLYTGFTPGDTHFVANHLIAAPDGWIYASMGGGAEVKSPDGTRTFGRVSSGVFRFKPDGSAIEQFSSKGGNGFGLDITSDGEVFFGQATSGSPVQHVVLPEYILARGRIGSPESAHSVIEHRKIVREHMPDRAPLMQIDVVGSFSAACASLIYEGGAWPAEWDRSTFCTEPILNIVHHEILKPAGPTFNGEKTRDAEFMFSHDYWFRPIECTFGPDGALYFLDFYTPVVAHSDTRGPQHGRAGASVRPDRDHYFGRIYRVQHEQARQLEIPHLAQAPVAELVKALAHPNQVVRNNAQRLLVDRGGAEVIAAVEPIADQNAFAPARILALWTLQRLNGLKSETIRAALSDQDPMVRKSAALILETSGATALQTELVEGLKGSEAREGIARLRALAAADVNEKTAGALIALFPTLDNDWSRSAAVAALAANPGNAMIAALNAPQATSLRPLVEDLTVRLMRQENPAAITSVLIRLAAAPDASNPLKRSILEKLVTAKPGEITPELTAALRTLLASPDGELVAAALPIATLWDKTGALHVEVDHLVTRLLPQINDTSLADAQRARAATALFGALHTHPEVRPALERVLSEKNSNTLKQQIVATLGSSKDSAAGPILVSAFNQLSSEVQYSAFNALLTRADWALAFLDAAEKKQISLLTLGPARVFRLRAHPSLEVSQRATRLLNAITTRPSPDKDALIAKLSPEVSKPGNVARGKELFTANCATCHKFEDLGTEVGPVLTGMGVHGPENLLIDILDPSRQVDVGYETWNIETTDGQIQSGIIAQENASHIVLRMPGQQIEIPANKIKSRVDTTHSLMPEGFEALGADSLRDIIAFMIGDAGRFRALDLSGAFTADTRYGLYQSRDALNDTLHFRKFGIVQVEGVPFNIIDPAKSILGGNVIVLKGGGNGSFSHSFAQRVEIPVGLEVRRFYFLGGIAGWGAGSAQDGETIMTVTMVFAGGARQSFPLKNGVHFSDYVSEIDVPGSRLANGIVRDKQIRWFTIPAPPKGIVEKLILESPGSGAAPTTVAITADLSDAPLPASAKNHRASIPDKRLYFTNIRQ